MKFAPLILKTTVFSMFAMQIPICPILHSFIRKFKINYLLLLHSLFLSSTITTPSLVGSTNSSHWQAFIRSQAFQYKIIIMDLVQVILCVSNKILPFQWISNSNQIVVHVSKLVQKYVTQIQWRTCGIVPCPTFN